MVSIMFSDGSGHATARRVAGGVRRWTAAAAAALTVASGAVVLSVAGAAPAQAVSSVDGTITRAEVIQRAEHWLNKGIPYNQSGSNVDPQGRWYRTDCSGYVSMAWHLGSSRVTSTLGGVATQISRDQLQPGDIMLASAGHALLFDKWTDSSHTQYWAYEFGVSGVTHHVVPYPYYPDDGRTFLPYRYNRIADGTSPSGPDVSCAAPSSWSTTKHYINILATAPGYSGPSTSCGRVGANYTTSNPQYVFCRRWGGEVRDSIGGYNHWWLWTDLDTGGRGWISAYYIQGQGNDQADDMNTGAAIPTC